ncbi:MAG: DUF262 domain-containing protein [Thermomicrobiales bacterium]
MASIQDKIKFDPKGIGNVLVHGRLRVPLNQREYSWEETHVRDLFQDLAGAIESDKTYFLGTIVLTRGDDEIPEVTDGQQRLATTTILLAAIRDWFYRQGEMEHSDSIETEYLRRFARGEVAVVPRLQLNVDDNEFFVRFVLGRPDDPQRKTASPTKESHKLIKQASEIAAQHIRDIVEPHAEHHRKKVLNRWVDFITTDAQVIVLTVPDDLDTFLMFETLNDRGLKASQADLLKNYLLSQARDRVVEAQQQWAQMIGILQSLGQDDIELAYLHHLLITQQGPTRAAEIFNRVKTSVAGPTQALKFLTEAAESANDYAALFNSDHRKWNAYGTTTRKHISTMNRDLRVQQIRPLMFAVARHFSVKEAQLAFRLFVYWSVRFLVVGGRGGLLDRNYAIAAQDVGLGKIKTADELTRALSVIIPSDALFEANFREARVSANYLARYYLRAMERQLKGLSDPEWVPSDEENVINLEHVLPENPRDAWNHIPAETASAYSRRLGNMVLMQATKNSIVGNGSFETKKAACSMSAFDLTKLVAQHDNWGPTEIQERQETLANLAVETWPIRIK